MEPDLTEPIRNSRPSIRQFTLGCISLIFIASYFVLVPVFKSAREEGQIIACEGNLRQLGVAMLQYEDDNNQRLPAAGRWASCTLPYLTSSKSANQKFFHCPAAIGTSYGYALNKSLGKLDQQSFTAPNALVMLFECDSPNMNANGLSEDVAWDRHPNGANFLYADGHVQHILGTQKNPNQDNVTMRWSP